MAAFFYGYIFTQLPGGYVAEQFGAKLIFGLAVLGPSLLSVLTPFVARWNVNALVVLRILMGVTEVFRVTTCCVSCAYSNVF